MTWTFVFATFGPAALGLAVTFSGLLDVSPRWFGRAVFLALQLLLIYMFGYATLVAIGVVVAMLALFAVSAQPPLKSKTALLASTFFGLYALYWIFERYVSPLMAPYSEQAGAMQTAHEVAPLIAIVGVSYIGFKLVHFYLDYRAGEISAFSATSFLSWLLFFPSLVAGPMQRYQDWDEQFGILKPGVGDMSWGIGRIMVGLAYKIVIADNIYAYCLPSLSDGALATLPLGTLFLSACAYSVYLFLDFAGYCHIAIGTAIFWGIRLPENFKNPYISKNLAEFWNRWHITLSEILRDYIFYPLSITFKRSSTLKSFPIVAVAIPPIVTFMIAGLWHGPKPGYIIYGLLHGIGLAYVAIRARAAKKPAGAPIIGQYSLRDFFAILVTFLYVTLTFVFFSLSTESLNVLTLRLLGQL